MVGEYSPSMHVKDYLKASNDTLTISQLYPIGRLGGERLDPFKLPIQ